MRRYGVCVVAKAAFCPFERHVGEESVVGQDLATASVLILHFRNIKYSFQYGLEKNQRSIRDCKVKRVSIINNRERHQPRLSRRVENKKQAEHG